MRTEWFDSAGFWRSFILFACVVAFVVGFRGVTSAREFGEQNADVHVPAAWYLLAIIPPAVIACSCLALPHRFFQGTRGASRGAVFVIVAAIFCGTDRLLQMIYQFELRSEPKIEARAPK